MRALTIYLRRINNSWNSSRKATGVFRLARPLPRKTAIRDRLRNKIVNWTFAYWLLISLFACAERSLASNISAIWANDGEDKVTQDELRATRGGAVTNSLWNGAAIARFG